ncbi:hypothetical protein SAMN04488102_10282 [Alkalibacterium subtropicum]|uniref:Cystine transport system permease protein n=1 Tax=Alkalibacterium subtropicum TaxID=753702 RepID=A0A1I1FFA6_9LACT|nr:hypothetical protein [Alkalibacterium subtropicum]SFB98077.1 hypothetical protein SAMN04488102_10282 [Alkalibacterium subtropicum]
MEEVMIEFYKGKDEQDFLDRWQEEHDALSEDQIDELYADIADAIDEAVKKGEHELGESYTYKGVPVGRSDFNAFYSLYLFEATKD